MAISADSHLCAGVALNSGNGLIELFQARGRPTICCLAAVSRMVGSTTALTQRVASELLWILRQGVQAGHGKPKARWLEHVGGKHYFFVGCLGQMRRGDLDGGNELVAQDWIEVLCGGAVHSSGIEPRMVLPVQQLPDVWRGSEVAAIHVSQIDTVGLGCSAGAFCWLQAQDVHDDDRLSVDPAPLSRNPQGRVRTTLCLYRNGLFQRIRVFDPGRTSRVGFIDPENDGSAPGHVAEGAQSLR